uniref:zinc finger protein 407 isoform X3 n=1 Tax=Myxine glutinosa TaxID=7769 RepID=UPI00358FF3F2
MMKRDIHIWKKHGKQDNCQEASSHEKSTNIMGLVAVQSESLGDEIQDASKTSGSTCSPVTVIDNCRKCKPGKGEDENGRGCKFDYVEMDHGDMSGVENDDMQQEGMKEGDNGNKMDDAEEEMQKKMKSKYEMEKSRAGVSNDDSKTETIQKDSSYKCENLVQFESRNKDAERGIEGIMEQGKIEVHKREEENRIIEEDNNRDVELIVLKDVMDEEMRDSSGSETRNKHVCRRGGSEKHAKIGRRYCGRGSLEDRAKQQHHDDGEEHPGSGVHKDLSDGDMADADCDHDEDFNDASETWKPGNTLESQAVHAALGCRRERWNQRHEKERIRSSDELAQPIVKNVPDIEETLDVSNELGRQESQRNIEEEKCMENEKDAKNEKSLETELDIEVTENVEQEVTNMLIAESGVIEEVTESSQFDPQAIIKGHVKMKPEQKDEQSTADVKCRRKGRPRLHASRVCNECGYVAATYTNLGIHIRRRHVREYHFLCRVCRYYAVTKGDIDRHCNTAKHRRKAALGSRETEDGGEESGKKIWKSGAKDEGDLVPIGNEEKAPSNLTSVVPQLFHCKVCNLYTTTLVDMVRHASKKEHQSRHLLAIDNNDATADDIILEIGKEGSVSLNLDNFQSLHLASEAHSMVLHSSEEPQGRSTGIGGLTRKSKSLDLQETEVIEKNQQQGDPGEFVKSHIALKDIRRVKGLEDLDCKGAADEQVKDIDLQDCNGMHTINLIDHDGGDRARGICPVTLVDNARMDPSETTIRVGEDAMVKKPAAENGNDTGEAVTPDPPFKVIVESGQSVMPDSTSGLWTTDGECGVADQEDHIGSKDDSEPFEEPGLHLEVKIDCGRQQELAMDIEAQPNRIQATTAELPSAVLVEPGSNIGVHVETVIGEQEGDVAALIAAARQADGFEFDGTTAPDGDNITKTELSKTDSCVVRLRQPLRSIPDDEKASESTQRTKTRPRGKKRPSACTDPTSLVCEVCGFKADGIGGLHVHQTMKHGSPERPFFCLLCGKAFRTEDNLLHHQTSCHHLLMQKKFGKQAASGVKPHCFQCHIDFPSEIELVSHMSTKHESMRHKVPLYIREDTAQINEERAKFNGGPCPHCGKKSTGSSVLSFLSHIRTHTGSKPFHCTICNFSAAQLGDIRTHVKRHLNLCEYYCSVCGNGFIMKKHMLKHMLKKHGLGTKKERCFSCDICSRSFAEKWALRGHRRLHLGHKPFPCTWPQCHYSFLSRYALRNHMNTHTGEKKYLCDQCGFAGGTRHALTKHRRQHTGDRPFKCDLCAFASTTQSHLTRHRRVHTGEKPYRCPWCEYRSNCPENIRKHILSTGRHKGVYMYNCPRCTFGTNSPSVFRNHLKENHPDIENPDLAYLHAGIVSKAFECRLHGRGAQYVQSNISSPKESTPTHDPEPQTTEVDDMEVLVSEEDQLIIIQALAVAAQMAELSNVSKEVGEAGEQHQLVRLSAGDGASATGSEQPGELHTWLLEAPASSVETDGTVSWVLKSGDDMIVMSTTAGAEEKTREMVDVLREHGQEELESGGAIIVGRQGEELEHTLYVLTQEEVVPQCDPSTSTLPESTK